MDNQVVSKKRVADHGEVYTSQREVNAMLDLVKDETEKIDSRFLEPACGTGNFLTEILKRKMRVVASRYRKSQLDYERAVVLAVSSIYGIDILEDNVQECRRRLFDIFDQEYTGLFKKKAKEKCRVAVRYILERNIIHGDALTLTKVETSEPIVFPQWSLASGSMMIRQDYAFHELLPDGKARERSLFSAEPLVSDLGGPGFIPEPVREFPPTHFLEIVDVEERPI